MPYVPNPWIFDFYCSNFVIDMPARRILETTTRLIRIRGSEWHFNVIHAIIILYVYFDVIFNLVHIAIITDLDSLEFWNGHRYFQHGIFSIIHFVYSLLMNCMWPENVENVEFTDSHILAYKRQIAMRRYHLEHIHMQR